MPSKPDTAFAAAASAVVELAGIVARLCRAVPVSRANAGEALRVCRAVSEVLAPAMAHRRDVGAVAAMLVKAVQSLGRDAEPADAAAAFAAAAREAASAFPLSASPVMTRRYALARALAASVEIALQSESWLAEGRAAIGDRRSADAARARILAALDGCSDRIADALGSEALALLQAAARNMAQHLVDKAGTIAPMVRVDITAPLPSTAMAWRLYADPSRGSELVHRSGCLTPLFMPLSLEALSPNARAS